MEFTKVVVWRCECIVHCREQPPALPHTNHPEVPGVLSKAPALCLTGTAEGIPRFLYNASASLRPRPPPPGHPPTSSSTLPPSPLYRHSHPLRSPHLVSSPPRACLLGRLPRRREPPHRSEALGAAARAGGADARARSLPARRRRGRPPPRAASPLRHRRRQRGRLALLRAPLGVGGPLHQLPPGGRAPAHGGEPGVAPRAGRDGGSELGALRGAGARVPRWAAARPPGAL